jgi:NADH:ubiquinone oxidoreductase subunit 6 (subunit J)
MKKFFATALAVLVAFTALIPVLDSEAEARKRHRGRAVAAGVILGVAAAAIIANSSRAQAEERNSHYYGPSPRQCRRWYNRCTDGSNYACEQFETRGCTE